MPPRRMGSISVVVVFSSRLNFFSGGPEPPSPAARLLPGPDMAAAAKRGAGSPEGRQAGGGCTPVTCRRQSAKMWRRSELRNRASQLPLTYQRVPAPPALSPSPAAGSANRRHLGLNRTSLASLAQSAGARGSPGCGEIVSISCFYRSRFVPPLGSVWVSF